MQQLHNGFLQAVYPCLFCGLQFQNVQALHLHIPTHSPNTDFQRMNVLDDAAQVYRKDYLPPTPSVELTVGRDEIALTEIIRYEASVKRYAKCSMVAIAEYVKRNLDGDIEASATIYLRSGTFTLTLHQDYAYYIARCLAEITINSIDFVFKGACFLFSHTTALYLCVDR